MLLFFALSCECLAYVIALCFEWRIVDQNIDIDFELIKISISHTVINGRKIILK